MTMRRASVQRVNQVIFEEVTLSQLSYEDAIDTLTQILHDTENLYRAIQIDHFRQRNQKHETRPPETPTAE